MTRGSVHFRRRAVSAALATALTGAAIAIPIASGSTASAGVYQSPGLTPGKTQSGVVILGGAQAAKNFGTWRKSPVTTIVAYSGTDSWNSFTNIAGEGLTGYWNGIAAHHVWSVPLIPSDGFSTIQQAASGAYDSKYAAFAKGLVAGGDGNATIRLGWEMTGDWFAWSGVKDPASWASGFRHAVTAMRTAPGQHFTFDFSEATNHVDPTPFYPGDAYVDLIGGDQYDVAWNTPQGDHAKAWAFDLVAPGGLNWIANFAAAHGKRISLGEWGLSYRCDGHGGGDDPYFIDQMRGWINSHDVAYEAYFEADDNSCTRFSLTSGIFPNGANEYVKQWSGASNTVTNPVTPVSAPPAAKPAPPAPPVTPAGAPAAPVPANGLLVSYNSDRSGAVALANAKVTKPAYIFYATTSPVRQVTFSLDGKAYRTETSAAYDLVGTAVSGAKPFAPSTLKPGKHTVSAQVVSASGSVSTSSASFTIPGPAVKTLTTRFLRVSSAPVGHGTVRLDRALLRGTSYLIFPKIVGQAKATYWLDGKVVRIGKPNGKGVIKVSTLTLAGLPRGLHLFVLHITDVKGHVKAVKARFRIV